MNRRAITCFALFLAAVNMQGADANRVAALLREAQALARAKSFDKAARVYLEVLDAAPSSHDARLGLARVRLWQGRYGEARRMFLQLAGKSRHDVDAAEGAATAAYWSGDYRTARREFQKIAEDHPGRETVRRSLSELRTASAATEIFETSVVDDDQPFRAAQSFARVSIFTDPLTRWDGSAGGYLLNSPAGGRHATPFAVLRNETVLPSIRLTITPSLGAIRTPDGKTHATGGAATRFRLAPHDSISLSLARRELLSNATRLYPLVDVTALRWEHAQPWLASIGVERDRFSDHNSARAADAYALLPFLTTGGWTLSGGASVLSRTTRESRFYVNGITATRDPSGSFFHYSYRGGYDPYWTPFDLREARMILAVDRKTSTGLTMRVQGDAGRAHDRAVTFWPEAGRTPFPPKVGQSMFARTYSPWRIRFTSSVPLGRGITLDAGYEHGVTVFYRANTFHAALARRR
ncbi:MAG: hypothetical protein NVSMB68_02930 [Thermoanaerobaculia bacterium]